MTLKLRIANLETLPDGGPVQYSVDGRGFEFGRDSAMDWTLPDPNRFVSSCHGEIRCENGGYWLYDRSTNGTFVNGAAMRVKSPYCLQKGDRVQVGSYIVMVEEAAVAPAPAAEPPADLGPIGSPAPAPAAAPDIWSLGDAPSAPVAGFDPTPPPPRRPDFGDQHIDVPGFGANVPPDVAPDPVRVTPSPVSTPTPVTDDSPFGAAPAAKPEPAPEPPEAKAPAPSPLTPPEAVQEPGITPLPEAAPAPPPRPSASSSIAPLPGPVTPAAPPKAPPPTDTKDSAVAFGRPPSAKSVAPPPMETPKAEQVPTPPPPPTGQAAGEDAAALLRTLATAAGLNPDALAGTDPHATAHEIGRSLRIMTAELTALLRVRTTAKTAFRSSNRTELGRDANNPLKWIPSSEEAMETMFGKPRPGYQRGAEAVQGAFSDIHRHQSAVFAAIQPALAEILGDLAPETVEAKIESSVLSSKGARAWEVYVERWDAKTAPHENGMLDVFNLYFAKNYDAEVKGKKS